MESSIVYTIGYDARGLEEFIDTLRHYGVERVVDVRRWVVSRKLPVYSGENLSKTLSMHGIDYKWIPELGGYRRFGVGVSDYGLATCFRSQGFRAYATYIVMSSKAKPYLQRLLEYVGEKLSVIMCREKFPWRCHRKILADYLVAKGFEVIHIIDKNKTYKHKLHRCAEIVDNELIYR